MENGSNIELERRIVSLIDRELSRRSNGLNKELLERMVRVEEALVHQRELMQEGFKAVDKRFELIQENMNKRFEAVDKRFELMQNNIDKRFELMQEGFKAVDKRFEAVDKRFELMQENMNKRFEAVDKRFEAVDKRFDQVMNSFRWTIGLIVGSAVAIIAAMIRFLA